MESYNLINRPEKKYETSIMITGGFSSVGLSNIILFKNIVNEFTYTQIFLYFKEDFDKLQEKLMINYNWNRTEKHHLLRNQIKI